MKASKRNISANFNLILDSEFKRKVKHKAYLKQLFLNLRQYGYYMFGYYVLENVDVCNITMLR